MSSKVNSSFKNFVNDFNDFASKNANEKQVTFSDDGKVVSAKNNFNIGWLSRIFNIFSSKSENKRFSSSLEKILTNKYGAANTKAAIMEQFGRNTLTTSSCISTNDVQSLLNKLSSMRANGNVSTCDAKIDYNGITELKSNINSLEKDKKDLETKLEGMNNKTDKEIIEEVLNSNVNYKYIMDEKESLENEIVSTTKELDLVSKAMEKNISPEDIFKKENNLFTEAKATEFSVKYKWSPNWGYYVGGKRIPHNLEMLKKEMHIHLVACKGKLESTTEEISKIEAEAGKNSLTLIENKKSEIKRGIANLNSEIQAEMVKLNKLEKNNAIASSEYAENLGKKFSNFVKSEGAEKFKLTDNFISSLKELANNEDFYKSRIVFFRMPMCLKTINHAMMFSKERPGNMPDPEDMEPFSDGKSLAEFNPTDAYKKKVENYITTITAKIDSIKENIDEYLNPSKKGEKMPSNEGKKMPIEEENAFKEISVNLDIVKKCAIDILQSRLNDVQIN